MAFHINQQESLGAAWTRIEQEQIQKILRDAELSDLEPDTVVHEMRKRFKKLRALAKLFRYLNPEYKQKNRYYRDLGRRLSELRDARVQLDLLHQLETDSGQDLSAIRNKLQERYETLTEGGQRTEGAIRAVVDDLKGRTQDAPVPETLEDSDAILKGFQRVYRRAHHGHQASFHQSNPDEELDFHEYRKRTKYHYLQTQLLQKAWPQLLKPRRKAVETLATRLGEDHDITLIHQILPGPEETNLADAETLYTLTSLLREKRGHLRQMALPLGERIFIEKPKHLCRRVQAYWEQCRGDHFSAPVNS